MSDLNPYKHNCAECSSSIYEGEEMKDNGCYSKVYRCGKKPSIIKKDTYNRFGEFLYHDMKDTSKW